VFFYALDRNLEDVDSFYTKKYGDAARRLKLLQDQYGNNKGKVENLARNDAEDFMESLLELRNSMRNLKWYGEVNRKGFVKITKKLDKKIPGHDQRRYLETKVDVRPFAFNIELSELIQQTSDWLSLLSELKHDDDDKSIKSNQSIPRISAKPILDLPETTLNTINEAIRDDNHARLITALRQDYKPHGDLQDPLFQRLLLNLLQRAISCRSRNCISALLAGIATLEEGEDLNERNCLHRYVISLHRGKHVVSSAEVSSNEASELSNYITPAAPPVLARPVKEDNGGSRSLQLEDDSVQLLLYILDSLKPEHRSALQARDMAGRMPLHYAAQYGLVVACEIIVERMQAWQMFEVAQGIDAPFWQDADGYSPLHLSVLGGHPLTTLKLLESQIGTGDGRSHSPDELVEVDHATRLNPKVLKNMTKSGEILALATKSNFVVIVQLLVDSGAELDYQDEQGETALHLAARFGFTECAEALLKGSESARASTEIPEKTFGWTPLFTASVDGHLPIVEQLIEAGADLERQDFSGWTAKEHASLRGHIHIAKLLAQHTSPPVSSASGSYLATSPTHAALLDRKSANGGNSPAEVNVAKVAPVKTFGHRYLTDTSMILVTLGSMDPRKNVHAINLDRIPLTHAHSTQLDTALSVVVSAVNATGEPSIVDLPVQENIATEPVVFNAADASKVKLLFDIIPTYSGSKDRIVGRAVALLSSLKPSLGSSKISLQGEVTIPIIAAQNLEVIGTVVFNYLVITPFKHPNMMIGESHTYWKSLRTSTKLIGHRGLGKNMASRKSLQLGENTIQSFIAAANLGAEYVEFDVQLTKDLIPVIYHDFLVSETGIDAPVHTLTCEQFLHMNDGRTPRQSRPPSPARTAVSKILSVPTTTEVRLKNRSMSVGAGIPGFAANGEDVMAERMKHTRDFKAKGYKANSRHVIQDKFTTLSRMFAELPAHLGFNVEMKYPMLHESEEQEMDTYAVELNSFVDTVLKTVYDLAGDRHIIFSSFNPDICLLLSFKQPSIPILFLTDAGTSPVGDVRASSLQEAIRFASRWNLLGVVTAAEPLCLSPRLIRVVRESGLVCMSYGMLNNDKGLVKRQRAEGIDAVIVDDVLEIRKELRDPKIQMAGGELPSIGAVIAGGVSGNTGRGDGGGLLAVPKINGNGAVVQSAVQAV
jgi:glycerophosphodiester phosphodiesterase